MQIEQYQAAWGIYTGNDGKLTARLRVLAVLFYYCSALIVTVLTRQLHVVVVR